jgi:hypothetical protein
MMSVKLFKSLRALVSKEENYDFAWNVDKVGDLVDSSKSKICYFPNKEAIDFLFIQAVPEILRAIKETVEILIVERQVRKRNSCIRP